MSHRRGCNAPHHPVAFDRQRPPARKRPAALLAAGLVALGALLGGAQPSRAANPGFALGAPSSVTAGTAFSITVSATNSGGHLNSAYTGAIHFTSTDANASLPSDYSFVSADAGSHTFTGVLLRTAGLQSITATDKATPALTGSDSMTVAVGPVAQLAFATPALARTGVAFTGTVIAQDSSGNVVTSYTGSVAFTSGDALATFGTANYTFVAGDHGSHPFTGNFTLRSLGSQTLTVTDSGHAIHTTNAVTVSGPATKLVATVNPPSSTDVVTHTPTTVTVAAEDSAGHTDPVFTDTVHFTSSDGTATLPANYAFTAADQGSHAFAGGVTLNTVGSQTVTASDVTNVTITQGQGSVTVEPGPASVLHVTAPATVNDGGPFTVTVAAVDAFGNVATAYTGTIHFTSSDAKATLPADYTFVGGDSGSHTFTGAVTLNTAGSQTVTATDTATSTITGSSAAIAVASGGPAVSLTVAAPSHISAGQSFSFTVTARDGSGATSTGYRGTVHFTSTDVTATLPANYVFSAGDAGSHVFTATFNSTVAPQTITGTDTVTSSITGTSSGTTVAGLASKLVVVETPSTVVAGAPATVSVTAEDGSNNIATNYTGTVHLTSTDGQAVLPANHVFTTGDCGVPGQAGVDCGAHQFTVHFHAAGGPWTVTGTDTLNGTITGTSANVTVDSAPASQLVFIAPPASTTAGSPFSLTVRAEDPFGNQAQGTNSFTDTVHFTSTDASTAAVLPADYAFLAGDNGQKTFAGITLATAPSQTVAVADATDAANVTGTSAPIAVNPAGAAQLVLAGPSTVVAGTGFNLRVSAYDGFGNVATGYTGTVHFTSSDGVATLPSNYMYVSGDHGMHTFSVTLNTPGSTPRSVTGTDTVTSSITGSESFTVAGTASAMSVVASGAGSALGAPFTVTVSLTDAFGNPAIGYTGTVHFTSSDTHASLPANYTFTTDTSCGGATAPTADCGSHVFSVTLNSAGLQSVVATDTGTASLTGTASVTGQQPQPVVASVSPNAGPAAGGPPAGSATVAITGTSFSGIAFSVSDVRFGSSDVTTPCPVTPSSACFTVVSATEVDAFPPAGSGQQDVTVITRSNDTTYSSPASSTTPSDLYTYVTAPTVSGVSPNTGPTAGGTTVTVTGANFSAAGFTVTSVRVGATTISTTCGPPPCFTVDSPTQLTLVTPPGAVGTVDITLATPGGTSATSAADQFRYQPPVWGVVMDGLGGLHPFGGGAVNTSGASYWPWDIARASVLLPDGSGGYQLDGYGGVHPFGSAPQVALTAYWPGWDIARSMVLRPDGVSGYVLDGYGGVHPFGGAPQVAVTAYWPGWDVARSMALRPDGVSGYVLDAYGALHPFGGAPQVAITAYWSGWDIARGAVLRPDGVSGYVLDGLGGIHPFGGAPQVSGTAYWSGWEIARAIASG